MKLRTKLMALCAALLLLVAMSLTAAMLWQVRAQSYDMLLESSNKTLTELSTTFEQSAYRDFPENGAALETFLTYCFRSCGVPGSALLLDGKCLYAATTIAPEKYLDASNGTAASARAYVQGKHFLILGKALDIREKTCRIYLVEDAGHIYAQLWQLSGRFALLALVIGLLGLGGIQLIISRTLRPRSELTQAAERIAGGSYSQRVSVRSSDEVGKLAGNFNRMAAAVETHVDTLREQNQRQKLFIGAVTHELKTPLTSLLLNVNTLKTVYLPEEKQEALFVSMDTQLHWLETMVKKLLTLLSMQKNARRSESSVPELLERAQTLTEPICAKYGVSLKTVCHVNTLSMDSDLMCSALVNLVENSAKASNPGDVIEVQADQKGFVVMDHGRGIPEKELARVTDPFYMGDPSRSKQSGGFGLGLALVKEIAAVHGGRLEIESQPERGTTARITLPHP